MAGTEASSKFFEALNESTDAFIDSVRAANDRGHRFSIALLEQAQESQREAVELAKRWIASPFDVLGLVSAVVENATKAQGRALEASRQWFGELSEAQKETRETVQRVLNANRAAGQATVDMARDAFNRNSSSGQKGSNGDGLHASRELTRTETPAS